MAVTAGVVIGTLSTLITARNKLKLKPIWLFLHPLRTKFSYLNRVVYPVGYGN